MFFLMNIKPFSRLKGRWGSLPQKMIKQEKKQHFSKKGKGINVTQNVTLHSHRDYIDSLHQKIFEWFYFWFHGFMSKWQKHPLNEVKIILQLSRVLQIQGISKSKEQAHGMWKIFRSSITISPSKHIVVPEDWRCSESREICWSSGTLVRIPMGMSDTATITYQMSPSISMAENTTN